MRIDETDRRIIEVLKEDARKPYVAVAKEVGLSEASIRKRVKKLVKAGVLRFKAEFKLEEKVKAIMLVRLDPSTPTGELLQSIKMARCVREVYEIAGDYDVAILLSSANIEDMNRSIIPYVISQASYQLKRMLP